MAYWAGGWIRTTGFPIVQADFIIITAKLPQGSPFSEVEGVADHIERGVIEVKNELNQGEVPFARIGTAQCLQ